MFQKEFKLAYRDAKLKLCHVRVLLHYAMPRAVKIAASVKNLLVVIGYSL